MAKVEIELNREGVKELMQSKEMMAICREIAERAADTLGSGYEVTTYVGKTRVNASISAESYRAKKENLETNSILKALNNVKGA